MDYLLPLTGRSRAFILTISLGHRVTGLLDDAISDDAGAAVALSSASRLDGDVQRAGCCSRTISGPGFELR